jgi:cytoskeletal protein CcmA (bactofilin family)
MKDLFGKNAQGSITVIVALILTVLMGFAGLAVDIGNLFVLRGRMQNAVDAAVCGGGLKLPDQSQATAQAKLLITDNHFTPVPGQPTFDPTNAKKISYTLTNDVLTIFMGLFGYGIVPITVSAEGILLQSGGATGPFNYALFSHKPLTMSGNERITGSVHSNDALTISGNVKITNGTTEGKEVTLSGNSDVEDVIAVTEDDITISGNAHLDSKLGGVDTNIPMPDYSQQMQDIAATKYCTNKTFSGNLNINGSIYVDGNVTISGNLVGTGAIISTGNITISGNINITGSNQVCLYSEQNITLSGNLTTGTGSDSAIIYAPNGLVTISGNSNFNGSVIANQITESGNLRVKKSGSPITTLPAGKQHVKLIR